MTLRARKDLPPPPPPPLSPESVTALFDKIRQEQGLPPYDLATLRGLRREELERQGFPFAKDSDLNVIGLENTPVTTPTLPTTFDAMPEDIRFFLLQVGREVIRARSKFSSDWTMTALTEEVGELAKAMLDEPSLDVVMEAIQVACMACRVATEGDPTISPLRAKRGHDLHPAEPKTCPYVPRKGDRVTAKDPGGATDGWWHGTVSRNLDGVYVAVDFDIGAAMLVLPSDIRLLTEEPTP